MVEPDDDNLVAGVRMVACLLLVAAGSGCGVPSAADGGAGPDAGTIADAGRDAGPADAGGKDGGGDAGPPDAGSDGGLPAWPADAYFFEATREYGFFGVPCATDGGAFLNSLTWEVSPASGAVHAFGCRGWPPPGKSLDLSLTLSPAQQQVLSGRLAAMTVAGAPRCFADIDLDRLTASTPRGRLGFVGSTTCFVPAATTLTEGLSAVVQVLDEAVCAADAGC